MARKEVISLGCIYCMIVSVFHHDYADVLHPQ
jgi:hypothetical protein